MQKINCNVNNCSHNNSGTCYANRIDVRGQSATNSSTTCCGSFLDSSSYGTLTNNTNDSGPCSCIVCKVDTCTYNDNNLCNLNNITVSSDTANARLYSETSCFSFEKR